MMHFIERKKARIIVANLPKVIKEALTHVPEVRSRMAVAASVDEARRSLDLTHSALVDQGANQHSSGLLILALSGGKADGYAIAVATGIARMRSLKVIALFPILVPQSLPTDTPMPEAEERADGALKVAHEIFKAKQIPVNLTIQRSRSLAAAVEAVAREMDERTAIISLPDVDVRKGEPVRTASELLEKIGSEVILVRPPKDAKQLRYRADYGIAHAVRFCSAAARRRPRKHGCSEGCRNRRCRRISCRSRERRGDSYEIRPTFADGAFGNAWPRRCSYTHRLGRRPCRRFSSAQPWRKLRIYRCGRRRHFVDNGFDQSRFCRRVI
jgi:hypothetical protein